MSDLILKSILVSIVIEFPGILSESFIRDTKSLSSLVQT